MAEKNNLFTSVWGEMTGYSLSTSFFYSFKRFTKYLNWCWRFLFSLFVEVLFFPFCIAFFDLFLFVYKHFLALLYYIRKPSVTTSSK